MVMPGMAAQPCLTPADGPFQMIGKKWSLLIGNGWGVFVRDSVVGRVGGGKRKYPPMFPPKMGGGREVEDLKRPANGIPLLRRDFAYKRYRGLGQGL